MLNAHWEANMDVTLNLSALDKATRAWIQDEARRTGTSLEEVIERLIQRSVALERQTEQAQRYHDLDSLAGTWSEEETNAFRAATADFAQVDPALWQ
jgi:hypothetical protein